MSVFDADFTKVEASIPIYPKARYRLKCTKKTPLIEERDRRDKDTGAAMKVILRGVRYAFEMFGRIDEDGNVQTKDDEGVNLKGRAVSTYTVWTHSEGGLKFAKPFLMAAGGFPKNKENEANSEFFQKHEWYIKGDTGADAANIQTGSGYDVPVGKLLDVSLDKSVTKDETSGKEYENQEFNAWSPVDLDAEARREAEEAKASSKGSKSSKKLAEVG